MEGSFEKADRVIQMILITGDLGFIGTHLSNSLEGLYRITGFDLKRGEDIRDKYQLWSTFEAVVPKVVIHLAAKAGVRKGRLFAEDFISTNILGTQNVVDCCEEFGVEKLIFFSSSSVFGESNPPVKEEFPKTPISLYGITKLAGECIVRNARTPATIVRPFTVYGENGRQDSVLWRWIRQVREEIPITVYGDASSCRGYVYVQDVVSTMHRLIETKWLWGKEDFNIGGSEVIYLRDLIQIFRKVSPHLEMRVLPANKEDVHRQWADTSKARRVLKFNPVPAFSRVTEEIIRSELRRGEKK